MMFVKLLVKILLQVMVLNMAYKILKTSRLSRNKININIFYRTASSPQSFPRVLSHYTFFHYNNLILPKLRTTLKTITLRSFRFRRHFRCRTVPKSCCMSTILPLSGCKPGRRHWLLPYSFFACLGFVAFLAYYMAANPFLISDNRGHPSSLVQKLVPTCDVYMAESALPGGGLGIFTGVALSENQLVKASPDICLYVVNASEKTEHRTHTWQDFRFGAQWLGGSNPRAECMGIVTLFNSMAASEYASVRTSADRGLIHDNAGLNRKTSPGAGAVTQYYGATATALRDLKAGSELMIPHGGFGKSAYKPNDPAGEPHRSLAWLQRHGFCLDHIVVKTATDPSMGRGAFAKRSMHRGTVVSPAPIQVFQDRAAFTNTESGLEELIVNFSFQPKNSSYLLYPYGQGFGLINHNSDKSKINLLLRWSTNHMNHSPQWIDPDISLEKVRSDEERTVHNIMSLFFRIQPRPCMTKKGCSSSFLHRTRALMGQTRC